MSKALRIVFGVVGALLAVAALVALFVLYLMPRFIQPAVRYKQADILLASGRAEQASEAFAALGDYRDSPQRVLDIAYARADALFQEGRFEEAMEAFAALGSHRDSQQRVEGCRTAILDRAYDEAVALLNAQKYEEAMAAFNALNGHRDSAAMVEECRLAPRYDEALALFVDRQYAKALDAFTALGDYRDSAERVDACYQGFLLLAQEALKAGNVPKAMENIGLVDTARLDLEQRIQLQKLYAGCGKALEEQADYAAAFRLYERSGLSIFEKDMARCNEKYVSEPHLLFRAKKWLQSAHWIYEKGKIIFTIRYAARVDTQCHFRIYANGGLDDHNMGVVRKNRTEFTFSLPYRELVDVEGLTGYRLDLPWFIWQESWEFSEFIKPDTFRNADKDLYGNPLE